MKGIKKLFLGLVFLTLFGVAFKVETNAAVSGSLDSSIADATFDWESTATDAVKANLTFARPTSDINPVGGDFPDVPSTGSYAEDYIPIQIKQGTTILATKVLCLKTSTTDNTNGTFTYGVGANDAAAFADATHTVTATGGQETAAVAEWKTDFKNSADFDRSGSSVTLDLYVADSKKDTKTVTLYPVSTALDPTTATATIGVNSSYLTKLLPGESTVIDVTYSATPSTYRFNGFTSSGMETLPAPTMDGTKVSVTAEKSLNTTAASVTASFTSNAGLTFSPDITTSSVIEPNTSKTVTYTFAGGYEKSNVQSVTLDGTSIGTSTFATGTTTGNFTFNPGAASSLQKELKITMKDGNVFTRNFYVSSTTDVLTFDSDPICVTEDQEIDLYSWTNAKTGLEVVKVLEVMSKAKGKIQIVVGKKNYKNYLAGEYVKNIRIKGVEATTGTKASTGVDGLDMYSGTSGEDSVNVTVYPKPKIEVNSSSSSSSLNSSTSTSSSSEGQIKITMPTKICYDNVENDDTKTAKVKFTTSKGSKEAELTMNKTTGEDGLARHDYINSTALLEILEDLCDSDVSKEVTIKVWPKGDDTVYAEEKITAYRISLDGTAGAKYTVNGKDVSGHFYGLKGAKYTVKASAANGGTLDKTSSGDFNNGESFTFEVSGEKTLKAVYNGGASSSSSSRNAINGETGNLDDYDDVPKTGESKADIWILWSVLFISILGAGFMIWKRFGLVRAIAQADAEVKIAEQEERIEKEAKAKEDKLNMLKDLRNL